MRYISTRGTALPLGFGDALLTGLARDGGLYVPEAWPRIDMHALVGRSYESVAVEVMWPFVEGAIDRKAFEAIVGDAYATFRHPAVCPLVQIDDNAWILELFHGPTLAFKDVALQLVGRLFDHELARRHDRVTVVGATSGDTGSAAIEACRDRDNVDIIVLFPEGRVSEVQRRQMTTVPSTNVHCVSVDGTFDDCQDLVKAMFNDTDFRDRLRLSAVNSINWARVMAQIVYYVTSATSLGGPGRELAFSVPTGNFGNVLAGWAAMQMGLPVDQLVVGSNRNDILTRFLHSGVMATTGVHPTLSPSMDIQVSSNFERLLFEADDRRGSVVAEQMAHFREHGILTVTAEQLAWIRQTFDGACADDDRTLEVIADTYASTGMLIDPHTAVGLDAGRQCWRDPTVPMVTLATAHPSKFPDAVEKATGVRPGLPSHLLDLFDRPERCATLPNDLEVVEDFVSARSRASQGA